MVERRRYTRYEVMYKVIYYPEGNPRLKFSTASFNISIGGIGLKLKGFIKESEELCLLIFSPHKKVPVEAKGRVIWQSYLPNYDENRAGIKFTEIPWTQIKSIL